MGVKGSSSTLNTTDTSAAKVLKPAPSASEREGDEKAKYPEGAGKPQFPGPHNRDGYVGGPSRDRATVQSSGSGEYSTSQDSSGRETGHTSDEEYRANSTADQAPTAFGNFQPKRPLKPKGNNLKEGDLPQTNTHTGDVGGPHDPGRVAEEKMLSRNADTSAGGARGLKTERVGNQFDVLDLEEARD